MVLTGSNLLPPKRSNFLNLDFQDVVGQVGYVIYDGIRTNNQGTNSYVLIPSSAAELAATHTTVEDSDIVMTTYTPIGADTDFDFDLSPYLLPVTIEGNALVRFTVTSGSGVSDHAALFQVTIKIRKWDGSAETDLVTDARSTFTLTGEKIANFFMTLPIPKTFFKIGEQLRITASLIFTEAGGVLLGLGHNPKDTAINTGGDPTAFQSGGSRFVAAIPYKLQN